MFSGIARINLIEKAEESIDIAYYTVHDGVTTDIFFGSLLEAADRGVEVRVLLDGIFHNLRGSSRDIQYALVNHPNIELKFYEPFSLLKPWTWNNRLHDKHIIIDNKYGMIGGRNIGDKYFLQDYEGEIVHDRDVVIINTDVNNPENSVINDMGLYFDMVWHHDFSHYPIEKLSNRQTKKAVEKESYLKEILAIGKDRKPNIFNAEIDWYQLSVPTNKVTFIYNPITRLNKEPWVLAEISKLMEYGEASVLVQSPYVITTREMEKYIQLENIQSKEFNILTNSMASSPNYFAMAGYRNKRKDLVDTSAIVNEYHGEGSIHAKSFIIDNQLSLVGTFNVDARSAFLSTESMVVIDSIEFAEVLNMEIKDLLNKSLVVDSNYQYQENPFVMERQIPFLKRTIIWFLSIFAYFFDFML